jgi:hypothetical protein
MAGSATARANLIKLAGNTFRKGFVQVSVTNLLNILEAACGKAGFIYHHVIKKRSPAHRRFDYFGLRQMMYLIDIS